MNNEKCFIYLYLNLVFLLCAINLLDAFLADLVFIPGATGLPLNALGYFKPRSVCPSPHPCG